MIKTRTEQISNTIETEAAICFACVFFLLTISKKKNLIWYIKRERDKWILRWGRKQILQRWTDEYKQEWTNVKWIKEHTNQRTNEQLNESTNRRMYWQREKNINAIPLKHAVLSFLRWVINIVRRKYDRFMISHPFPFWYTIWTQMDPVLWSNPMNGAFAC